MNAISFSRGARVLWAIPVVKLFLASSMMLPGSLLAAESAATNASVRWPTLAEVLKKWDATSWEDIQRAAAGGEPTAQHYLGYCYVEAHRVSADPELGIQWYSRAGDAGYLPSLSNLGVVYTRGKVVPQDHAKALQYYHRAADAGFAPAAKNIGFSYRDGRGVPRDYSEAMKWFRRSADQGDSDALSEIGVLYVRALGVERDDAEARKFFQKAADQGNARGQFNLGRLHEEKGDFGMALPLYRKAAEQGSIDACFALYRCYQNGTGVGADLVEARRWLEKAAVAGNARAQTELGYSYGHPGLADGPDKLLRVSLFDAARWYRRAADQNYAPALRYLGACYMNGKGVEQDEERGLELIRSAADQGDKRALRELVNAYTKGIGEPRNVQDEPLELLQRLALAPAEDDYPVRMAAYQEIIFRYLSGLGTQRDWAVAAMWYCRATAADINGFSLADKTEAGFPLGRSFRFYAGPVNEDQSEGGRHYTRPDVEQYNDAFLHVLSLYCQAAGSNKPEAADAIATLYATGRNAPNAPPKAWVWFTIAAKNGSQKAVSKAAEMEKRMTNRELEAAHKLLPELNRILNQTAPAARILGN
jgi:TPR repeat protein